MRLTRIIAERFGALRSATLGELGEGLTVVLGPNEAGKTSFTTLVRYVLYGYPTKRGSEPDYECDAGKRLGRLVFVDGDGQWALERTEGAHGGPIGLHTLAGPDNPGLLDSVTQGVSRDAFRVVFGFGLDEMVQIETGRGAGIDILSRLYAAQAGLEVSPSDVRASLEADASELWRASGRNPLLNALRSSITQIKRDITVLEAEASSFARDQERLSELFDGLEAARCAREEATIRATELAAAAQRLVDLESRITESLEETDASRTASSLASEKRARVRVDERVLTVAPELEDLLGELSGFKSGMRRAAEQQAEVESLRARASVALASTGLDPALVSEADIGPETLAGIERWRTRLPGLESQALVSRRSADGARDAAVAVSTDSQDESTSGSGTGWVPGALIAVVGLVVAILGAMAADYPQALLGALVTGTGFYLALKAARAGHPRSASSGTASDASRAADMAQTAADRDATEFAQALAEWQAWLVERGLAHAGDDPGAVSLLITAIKEYRALDAEAGRLEAGRAREMEGCALYRDRLAQIAGQIAPDIATASLEDVPTHAARIRELLNAALSADRLRADLDVEIENLETAAASADRRASSARDDHSAVFERHGLAGSDAARLTAEADSAAAVAQEAVAAFDTVASEYTALSTRLDNEGRDNAMGTLRLDLVGFEERRDAALERYAVLAVAERLMARTQAFNEQARQPRVVQRASELFEMITEGRYVRLSVPADGGEFVVFDPDSRPRPSSELSTGTAQQLYLALRIALIETLDDTGSGLPVLMDDVLVNFDPARKRGAAAAIGHLATHRQVVLFTCHPETAELMEQVAPEHVRLSLDRC